MSPRTSLDFSEKIFYSKPWFFTSSNHNQVNTLNHTNSAARNMSYIFNMTHDFKLGIYISLRALSKILGQDNSIVFSSVSHDQKSVSADYMHFWMMTVDNYRLLAVQKYFLSCYIFNDTWQYWGYKLLTGKSLGQTDLTLYVLANLAKNASF